MTKWLLKRFFKTALASRVSLSKENQPSDTGIQKRIVFSKSQAIQKGLWRRSELSWVSRGIDANSTEVNQNQEWTWVVAASRSYSLSWSVGFFSCYRAMGSVIVMPGLSCPKACAIFPDQGLNPCIGKGILYHWTTSEVPLHSFLNKYLLNAFHELQWW